MPNTRGRAKRDIERAIILQAHTQQQLAWIVAEYRDVPDFSAAVEGVLAAALATETALKEILERLP
jgi:hypothetical protein